MEYNIWAISQAPGKSPSEVVQWTLVTEVICVPISNYAILSSWNTDATWSNPPGIAAGIMNIYVNPNIYYGDNQGSFLVITVDGNILFNECVHTYGQIQIPIPANSREFVFNTHSQGCFNPGAYDGNEFSIYFETTCGGLQ